MKVKITLTNLDDNSILSEETLSDEEVKASLTDMVSIPEWTVNAIKEKARRTIDIICDKLSDKKLSAMTKEEKYELIRDTELETAVERQARLDAELGT